MTSINGETGKNGFKLRLDYEVTKQSTADNKSTVHMVLYLYANTTGYHARYRRRDHGRDGAH